MEYGRLSGKLHSDEDWLSMDDRGRALVVSLWSWAIDHEKEDGIIGASVVHAISASLGHDGQGSHISGVAGVIDEVVAWGFLDDSPEGAYRITRWEAQSELIRSARQRREKERERYLRRKEGRG